MLYLLKGFHTVIWSSMITIPHTLYLYQHYYKHNNTDAIFNCTISIPIAVIISWILNKKRCILTQLE